MSIPGSDAAAMAAARRQPQTHTPVADPSTQASGFASNQPRGSTLPASVAATVLAQAAGQRENLPTVHATRQPAPPAFTQPPSLAQVAAPPATFTQRPFGHGAVQPSPLHAVRSGHVGDDPSSRAPSAPVPDTQTGYPTQSLQPRQAAQASAYAASAMPFSSMTTSRAPVQAVHAGQVGAEPQSLTPQASVPNAQTGFSGRHASDARATTSYFGTARRYEAPIGARQVGARQETDSYAVTSFPNRDDQAAVSATFHHSTTRRGVPVQDPSNFLRGAPSNVPRESTPVTVEPAPAAQRIVYRSTRVVRKPLSFGRFFTTIFWTSLALVILAFIGAAFSKRSH